MRTIGVLGSGEVPSASEAQDALAALNDLVDSWNTENLTLYNTIRSVFTLTPGKQSYVLGPGGDFSMPRPQSIEQSGIITLNNAAQPAELPMDIWTQTDWSQVTIKNVTSTLPTALYCDWNFPVSTVFLWPIPSVADQIALYTTSLLSSFAAVTTAVSLPPGYSEALRYALAVRLAFEFGRPLDANVAAMAAELKGNMKAANLEVNDMAVDAALVAGGRTFNWITGV